MRVLLALAIALLPGAAGAAGGNPFVGAKWYVDPYSRPAIQVREWRDTRPADARLIEKIASQPRAQWSTEPREAGKLAARYAEVTPNGELLIVVLYAIPHRDCGLYSRGGAANAPAYRRYVDTVARAIGSRRAAVVLEPDALPNVASPDCLTAGQRTERLGLLRYAADRLSRLRATAVYIDAGNAVWMSPEAIADLLRRGGIEQARGFALNVSNFQTTSASIAFGRRVSALTAGAHFVIDTSRNGRGPYPRRLWRKPEDEWCNPPGRALGTRPTARTAHPLVDAYLWVKGPGESDGECNGAPTAGVWWPEYALGLARRAAY